MYRLYEELWNKYCDWEEQEDDDDYDCDISVKGPEFWDVTKEELRDKFPPSYKPPEHAPWQIELAYVYEWLRFSALDGKGIIKVIEALDKTSMERKKIICELLHLSFEELYPKLSEQEKKRR